MNVDASPLAVSCLIEALRSSATAAAVLEQRCFDLGVDDEWLSRLGAKYLSVWAEKVSNDAPNVVDPVCEELPLVLSWLAAPIRASEQAAPINAASLKLTIERYSAATGSATVPPYHRLALTVGVVGRSVSAIDQFLPARFPTESLDPDVASAYSGLVEHVAVAGDSVWPEVHRTAVLWRLGGIAQGLVGGDDDLFTCMRQLAATLRGALPLGYRRMTTDDWIRNFRDNRNGLTHVRGGGGSVPFTHAVAEHEDLSHVTDYLRLASYYVGAAINEQLIGMDASTAARWVPAIDADFSWVARWNAQAHSPLAREPWVTGWLKSTVLDSCRTPYSAKSRPAVSRNLALGGRDRCGPYFTRCPARSTKVDWVPSK